MNNLNISGNTESYEDTDRETCIIVTHHIMIITQSPYDIWNMSAQYIISASTLQSPHVQESHPRKNNVKQGSLDHVIICAAIKYRP